MTTDELRISMLAKGFVQRPDGEWEKPNIKHHRNSGSTVQKQEREPKAEAISELSHPKREELENVADETAERDAAEAAASDYQAGVSTMEGEGNSKFRITVTLYVSGGRRDPTGMYETICDLLTATRRRLMERATGRVMESGSSPARKRRRTDKARENAFVKNPPF